MAYMEYLRQRGGLQERPAIVTPARPTLERTEFRAATRRGHPGCRAESRSPVLARGLPSPGPYALQLSQ